VVCYLYNPKAKEPHIEGFATGFFVIFAQLAECT
jgi:hypothetical protein